MTGRLKRAILIIVLFAAGCATGRVDYVIITADKLEETARAFALYREATGYRTRIFTMGQLTAHLPAPTERELIDAVRARIRSQYNLRDNRKPFYVLLVGDAQYGKSDRDVLLPADYKNESYTDNVYADMDGDGIPELAIGRIPVRENSDGLTILEKVKAHENAYKVGLWNRRLNIYAGTGNFGPEADGAIEWIVQLALEAIPYNFDVLFAYKNPRSEYYYTPFKEKVLDLINQGSILTAYMGHGGGELDVERLEEIMVKARHPMLAFFACGTLDYLSPSDSEGERLLKQAGAPGAILGSQTTSHPYGNAILAREMAMAVLEDRAPTFGEVIRLMKVRSMRNNDTFRQIVDAMAVAFVEEDEMAYVRRSHLDIYNLMGDPAMGMRLPAGLATVQAEKETYRRGERIAFSGRVNNFEAGTAQVTLEIERGRIAWELEDVENLASAEYTHAVQRNYSKAIDKVVDRRTAAVKSGAFNGELQVPHDIPGGTYYIKVYAENGETDATGYFKLKID